jgi:hypothetical protein
MSMSLNKKIENVQLEASRIVTGGTRLVSLNSLYMETGWEKLKDRREKYKLVQFYKMTKNVTPHYINCLVPQTFANIHDYNTRNASALPVVRTRTSLYYNSFIPSSVRLWNLQPDNIRLSPSIQALKYFLKSTFLQNHFTIILDVALGKFSIPDYECSVPL